MVLRSFAVLVVVFTLLMLVLAGCSAASSPLLGGAAGAPTSALPPMEATIDALALRLLDSFPVQVQAVVRGKVADGCVSIDRITSARQSDTFVITVMTKRNDKGACSATAATFEQVVALDVAGLPAGSYVVQAGSATGRFQLGADNVAARADEAAAILPTATPEPSTFPSIVLVTTPSAASLAAERSVRALLAQRLKLPVDKVEVVRVEATNWPNGCLGLPRPGEACTERITPGFRVTARVYSHAGQGKTHVYRTDSQGLAARPDTEATFAAVPPACSNRMAFVRDVSVPDNTAIAPGESFVKTWRLQNRGTCTWTRTYALVFDSGESMSGPEFALLPEEVPPQGTVDVSVQLVAPLNKGAYQGLWKLRPPNGDALHHYGDAFGVAETKRPFWVKITVAENATATPQPTGSTIGGRIWHDICRPPEQDQGTTVAVPFGCIRKLDGTYAADGVYREGEPPIGGPEVMLGKGECPSEGGFAQATVLAGTNGVYTFTDLVAGTYCVSIDSLSDYNLPILIPGEWTYPLDGKGMQTVDVDGSNNVTNADMAWDYQFAP